MLPNEEETAEVPARQQDPIVAQHCRGPSIEIAALTHRGCVRENNEDHYVVVRRTRSGEVMASSLADAEDYAGEQQHAWLMAVADGLGGHAAGEVASATALRTVLSFASGLTTWIMRPTDAQMREDIAERTDLYAQAIQQGLKQQAEENPGLRGMATTITAAYVIESTAIIVNVGDSRSYLLHEGAIEQITKDHTLAQALRTEGLSSNMAGRYHSVVTRTFSTEDKTVEMDLFYLTLEPGDRILLCSDGLSDMVPDGQILQVCESCETVDVAAERLVELALRRGGRDNITTILAAIQ